MIAEIVAGAIKGIYDVVKGILRTERPESVQEHIAKNEFIQVSLESMLAEIKASRIYVTQFHNGSYFYSGNPMQKFSMTYEAVNDWVAPTMGEMQNRLVSEYPLLHATLVEKGEFYVPDVSHFHDNTIRAKFEKRGIQTFYSVAIWDLGGNKVGNISVNYVGSTHDMTETEKQVIRDFAHQIVGFIIDSDEEKNTLVPKLVMGFLALTCASQMIYFLNNFMIMLHNFGPTAVNVLKALLDFL